MSKSKGLFSNLPILWWGKVVGILVALVFGILFSVPTFLGDSKTWPAWAHYIFPDSRVSLGLDLKGGLHLLLEVEVEQSLKDSITRAVNRAKDLVVKEGALSGAITVSDDYEVVIPMEDPTKAQQLIDGVKAQTRMLIHDKTDGKNLIFKQNVNEVEVYKKDVLAQAIKTIRNRIDQFGVAEPSIFQQGDRRIVVQMPGLSEPGRAKELIGNTAQLDFRLVLSEVTQDKLPELLSEGRKALKIPEEDTKAESIAKVSQWLRDNNKISRGATILLSRVISTTDQGAKVTNTFPYLVEAVSKLTGELIQDARAGDLQGQGMMQDIAVFLDFKPQGAKLFGELTGDAANPKNTAHALAIVLDDNVQSAPHVETAITGGSAQITMGSGQDRDQKLKEAQDLALVLKAGALPAKVNIIEEKLVGPSEGEGNIRAGMVSSAIAAGIVVFVMIFIYGFSGVIANLAMLFNILLTVAFLAAFGATLTLPGIAGMVLTMSIAVDGNVIINERIREELKAGATPKQAFYKGYNHSFSTLIDAHITSAVAGIVLLIYGNPAVKGFAITLLAGIVSTLFTSFYVTEVVGTWIIEKTKIRRFS